jgi:DNA repair photolyase
MGQAGLAQAGISVTTLDAALARRMEPRCPSPARRLQAIERLAAAGCPVRVMVSPIVPGLTDHELEAILKAARDAGAVAASHSPCACRWRCRSSGRTGWPSITPTAWAA